MKHFKTTIFIFSFFLFLGKQAAAAEAIGHIVFVKGDAQAIHQGETQPAKLAFNDSVFPMDTIMTGNGEVKVLLSDDTLLSLGINTKLLITEYVYKPKTAVRTSLFNVVTGAVRAIVSKNVTELKTSQVTFETPTAVAGIRGTDLGIEVTKNKTIFVCFDGAFDAAGKKNKKHKVLVTTGKFTEIVDGGDPTPPAPITPAILAAFSSQFENASANEIFNEAGSHFTENTPPLENRFKTTAPANGKENNQQLAKNESLEGGSLLPPQFLPGGVTQTPPSASASANGNMQPGAQPAGQPAPAPAPAPAPEPAPAPAPIVQAPVDIPIHFPGQANPQLPNQQIPAADNNPNGP